jgi:O-acetyl-ADP-ribose deacetylase (regulator of RNase III)
MSSAGPVCRQFGTISVSVVTGDITDQVADAIVNAANNRFWMGGGVAGAIKRKGGVEIEAEAMKQGPVDPGNAVATTAGRLKARYCIHAAVMGEDLVTCGDFIHRATVRSLELAAGLGVDSIAFPALGTGVGGFPVADAARLMVRAVVEHARSQSRPARVTFVLFDHSAYSAFQLELERAHGPEPPAVV